MAIEEGMAGGTTDRKLPALASFAVIMAAAVTALEEWYPELLLLPLFPPFGRSSIGAEGPTDRTLANAVVDGEESVVVEDECTDEEEEEVFGIKQPAKATLPLLLVVVLLTFFTMLLLLLLLFR